LLYNNNDDVERGLVNNEGTNEWSFDEKISQFFAFFNDDDDDESVEFFYG